MIAKEESKGEADWILPCNHKLHTMSLKNKYNLRYGGAIHRDEEFLGFTFNESVIVDELNELHAELSQWRTKAEKAEELAAARRRCIDILEDSWNLRGNYIEELETQLGAAQKKTQELNDKVAAAIAQVVALCANKTDSEGVRHA